MKKETKQLEVITAILNDLDIQFETCQDTCYPKADFHIHNLGDFSVLGIMEAFEQIAEKLDVSPERINTAIGKVWKDWLKAFDTCPIQTWDAHFERVVYLMIPKESMISRIVSLFGNLLPGLKGQSSITVNRFSSTWRVALEFECDVCQDFFSEYECLDEPTAFYKIEELFNWAMENEMFEEGYTLRAFLEWYNQLGEIIFKAFHLNVMYHVQKPERMEVVTDDEAPKEEPSQESSDVENNESN